MKLIDLILENTENFRVEEEGDWKNRIFLTAYLKDEKKTWLSTNSKEAELTVDINSKEKTAYLNYVQAHSKGKGYAADKNKRTKPEKLEMMLFDPVVRKHVLYKEVKIK